MSKFAAMVMAALLVLFTDGSWYLGGLPLIFIGWSGFGLLWIAILTATKAATEDALLNLYNAYMNALRKNAELQQEE